MSACISTVQIVCHTGRNRWARGHREIVSLDLAKCIDFADRIDRSKTRRLRNWISEARSRKPLRTDVAFVAGQRTVGEADFSVRRRRQRPRQALQRL